MDKGFCEIIQWDATVAANGLNPAKAGAAATALLVVRRAWTCVKSTKEEE